MSIKCLWLGVLSGNSSFVFVDKVVFIKNITKNMQKEIEKSEPYPIENLELYALYNDKGKVFYPDNVENISKILTHHPMFEGKLRLDNWTKKRQIFIDSVWEDIQDEDYIEIQCAVSTLYPFFCKVSDKTIRNATIRACKTNQIDSATDWIRSLPVWDRVNRLDTWLHTVYGSIEDPEYLKQAGSNFLKGIVARILCPGFKFDTVITFVGDQGLKKSMSLDELSIFEEWHVETVMGAGSKDFFMLFNGKLIIEFSEGATHSRSDVEQMKSIITTKNDSYRAPYGYETGTYKRRCVFAMTTNNNEFLKDDTGGRRYIPVTVTQVADIEWIKENKKQLFSEALYRFEILKETTYEYPESSKEYQSERLMQSGYEEKISKYINSTVDGYTFAEKYAEGFSILDVYEKVFPFNNDFDKKKHVISRVLKSLGYVSVIKWRNGIQSRIWVKK